MVALQRESWLGDVRRFISWLSGCPGKQQKQCEAMLSISAGVRFHGSYNDTFAAISRYSQDKAGYVGGKGTERRVILMKWCASNCLFGSNDKQEAVPRMLQGEVM